MAAFARSIRYEGGRSQVSGRRASVAFAIKVVGVGIFAGLILTYCNALLDACMSGIR